MIKRLDQILDCKSIHSIWNFTSNVLMSTENWVPSIQKNGLFFVHLETYSQIPLSKGKAQLHVFFLFTGLHLASISKCVKLFAVTWVSTAPSPCPGFSPGRINCIVMFGWWWVMPSDVWWGRHDGVGQGAGCIVSSARQCTAHRLDVPLLTHVLICILLQPWHWDCWEASDAGDRRDLVQLKDCRCTEFSVRVPNPAVGASQVLFRDVAKFILWYNHWLQCQSIP